VYVRGVGTSCGVRSVIFFRFAKCLESQIEHHKKSERVENPEHAKMYGKLQTWTLNNFFELFFQKMAF
jgi:hypothetical protein